MKEMYHLINTNSKKAEDQKEDRNKITLIMRINLCLKTFRLILVIINFSYFIGMSWLIICIILKDYRLHVEPLNNSVHTIKQNN